MKISKYLTTKNIGWLVLIFGLLLPLFVASKLDTYLDVRHGVGLWLDTWGHPNMYVDDPGDGISVATMGLAIICYIICYFLTLRKLRPLNLWQSMLFFVIGAIVFYFITSLLLIVGYIGLNNSLN